MSVGISTCKTPQVRKAHGRQKEVCKQTRAKPKVTTDSHFTVQYTMKEATHVKTPIKGNINSHLKHLACKCTTMAQLLQLSIH
jgi:hypothetical protein